MADDDITMTPQPWNGPIPPLDYWKHHNGNRVLSNQQHYFYLHLRNNLEAGFKVDIGDNYSYVSVLKDDIIRRYHSRLCTDRERLTLMAQRLVKYYGYKGNDLDNIINRYIPLNLDTSRKNKSTRRSAQWIPIGTSVTLDDGTVFTRGGFYVGDYLQMARFDVETGEFKTSHAVNEAPIIPYSASTFTRPQKRPSSNFSSFEELPLGDKTSLKDFLCGAKSSLTETGMIYYLAGWEARLLADPTTTRDERIDMINRLISSVKNNQGTCSHYFNPTETMLRLISITVGLFFAEEAETLFPALNVCFIPMILYLRFYSKYKDLAFPPQPHASQIEYLADAMPLPDGLPEVYHDDFRKHLRSEISYYINSQYFSTFYNQSEVMYNPISGFLSYTPSKSYGDKVRFNIRQIKGRVFGIVNCGVRAYQETISDLKYFLFYRSTGGSVLAQLRRFPEWLDAKKLPDYSEATAAIEPRSGELFRMISIKDLLHELGASYLLTDDKLADIFPVNDLLEPLGLMVAFPTTDLINLRDDDIVGVIENHYDNPPTRGTFLISIIIISWFLQADTITDADYACVHRWIDDYGGNADWDTPARALLLTLCSHKITLTARRKRKAAAIGKTVKRRQQFINTLLEIFSRPDGATAKRLKRLEQIYQLVGLDPATIHSDLQRLATTGSSNSNTRKTSIDRSKLRAITENTRKAQEILQDVFDEAEPRQNQKRTNKTASKAAKSAKSAKTKEISPVKALLTALAEKEEWQRHDFDALCKKLALIPGAALEQINDLSYDKFDESVADDDGDIIYIETHTAKTLAEKI